MTDQIRRGFVRVLRGPTGGMLACLLLSALLGGIAAADLGREPNGNASAVALQQGAPGVDGLAGAQGAEPGSHTEADCQALMEDAQLPEEEGARGLARAIYVVSGNCGENLDAPGLLVALQHLTRNFRRHMELGTGQQGAGDQGKHGRTEAPRPPSPPGRSGQAPGGGQAPGQAVGTSPNGS